MSEVISTFIIMATIATTPIWGGLILGGITLLFNKPKNYRTGKDIVNIQKMLNQKGYHLAIDGVYGSRTQAAYADYCRGERREKI